MAIRDLIAGIEDLSAADLTVQAQARSLQEVDPAGQLYHPAFFPYEPAPSVKLQHIFEMDHRYVADRREWNAPGRFIPSDLPRVDELKMVPVESYFRIGEEEQQEYGEQSRGNESVYKDLVMSDIPSRVNALVDANYRRIELDALEAWTNGQITARNPQTGQTLTVSLNYDANRLQTAATPWDDVGVNAYNQLKSWLRSAKNEYVGNILGVAMTDAILQAVLEDAPNDIPGISSDIPPEQGQVEDLLRRQLRLGTSFRFFINEATADVFDDGGTTVTRTRVWPDGYAAVVPAGGTVGATYRAPIHRAQDRAEFEGAPVDRNGMRVYYLWEDDGKTAKVQCQANWLSFPFERNLFTIDTGVTTA